MSRRIYRLIFATYIVLILIVAFLVTNGVISKMGYDRQPGTREKNPVNVDFLYKFYISSGLDTKNDIFYGNEEASIRMSAFLVFNSEESKIFISEVFPQIEEDYINKSIIKFSAQNYITLDDIEEQNDNFKYSLLLECVKKIKKENYYAVYFDIFLDETDIKELVKRYKISVNKYNQCINDEETINQIYKYALELERLGMPGINQRFYIGITETDNIVQNGIPEYDKFQDAIREYEMQIGN